MEEYSNFCHLYRRPTCSVSFARWCHVQCRNRLSLHELDNLVVRACFSVFKWSQEFRELSSAFNCIIGVFSVVELKKCVFSRPTSSKLVHGDS